MKNQPKVSEGETRTMNVKISFNGLRRNATRAYNEITQYLNESSLQDWEKQELEEAMEDLRFALAVLNASSVESEEDFKDMSEDLKFVDFNPNQNNQDEN